MAKHFFFFIMFGLFCDTLYAKFKLITTLYNETNKAGCAEYRLCLEKNLAHDLIDEIHICMYIER